MLLALAYVTFAEDLRVHMASAGYAGFTTRHGSVLRILLQGGPLSLRLLADRLRMSSQATLKLVDQMAAAGVVARARSHDDGRVRLVRLTDSGREALARAGAFHDRFESELADKLGSDAAAARRVLESIAERAPVVVPGSVRRQAHNGP